MTWTEASTLVSAVAAVIAAVAALVKSIRTGRGVKEVIGQVSTHSEQISTVQAQLAHSSSTASANPTQTTDVAVSDAAGARPFPCRRFPWVGLVNPHIDRRGDWAHLDCGHLHVVKCLGTAGVCLQQVEEAGKERRDVESLGQRDQRLLEVLQAHKCPYFPDSVSRDPEDWDPNAPAKPGWFEKQRRSRTG